MKKIIVGIVFSLFVCVGVSHGMMNTGNQGGDGNRGNNNEGRNRPRFVPHAFMKVQIENAIRSGDADALNDIIYNSGLAIQDENDLVLYIVDEYNLQ